MNKSIINLKKEIFTLEREYEIFFDTSIKPIITESSVELDQTSLKSEISNLFLWKDSPINFEQFLTQSMRENSLSYKKIYQQNINWKTLYQNWFYNDFNEVLQSRYPLSIWKININIQKSIPYMIDSPSSTPRSATWIITFPHINFITDTLDTPILFQMDDDRCDQKLRSFATSTYCIKNLWMKLW